MHNNTNQELLEKQFVRKTATMKTMEISHHIYYCKINTFAVSKDAVCTVVCHKAPLKLK